MKTPRLLLLLLALAAHTGLQAQDFLLQGCYWNCPEDEPGSLPDSATLSFWLDKMANQAPELTHAGFTAIWLPNLAPSSPPEVKRFLRSLEQQGLLPVAQAKPPSDSLSRLASYLTAFRDSLGVADFTFGAARPSPSAFASLARELERQALTPGLLIVEAGQPSGSRNLPKWLISTLAELRDSASTVSPRVYDYELREALRRASADSTFDARLVFERSLRDAHALSGYHVVTLANHPIYKNQNGKMGDADDLMQDPLLAYAYLLTNNQIGLPSIYYGDYYGADAELAEFLDKPALQQHINQLISIHQQYIFNATSVEYLNARASGRRSAYLQGDSTRALVFQLDGAATPAGKSKYPKGSKDVVVAINFGADTLDLWQHINAAHAQPGDFFEDVTGLALAPRLTIEPADSASGTYERVHIQVPPKSYGIWVQGRTPRVVPSRVKLTTEPYTNRVELTWEVAYERKVLGYEVERSINGGPYQKIKSLAPIGKGKEAASYLFLDQDVFPEEELRYRVKLLDTEGGVEMSPPCTTRLLRPELQFELLQPPGQHICAVRVKSNYKGKTRIGVFDVRGRPVFEQDQNLNRGENTTQINLQQLPSGVYYVKFLEEGKALWSTKVVKL